MADKKRTYPQDINIREPQWPVKITDQITPKIPCPIHGTLLEIKIEDGKETAICKCKVPDNPWMNRVVWERSSTRRTV
jgi:hypothetical protein